MAKYIRCIQPQGSLVLFDGLVAMEYLNELRVSDAVFLRTDIQNAITAGDLIEIATPGSVITAPLTLIGDWDANVEVNYPPAIYGSSYKISDGGQLTNGIQTETYSTGDRIFYNLDDLWEKVGSVSGGGVYTGGVWIVGAEKFSVTDTATKVTNADGSIDSFDSNGATVLITIMAAPNASGDLPIVTFDGLPVTMTVSATGIVGTIAYPMASGVKTAVHENGATDSITLSAIAALTVSTAVITDTLPILTGYRTEFKDSEVVGITYTTSAQADFVQVRYSKSFLASATVAVPVGLGPHVVPATVAPGVATEAGEIRVGKDYSGTTQWSPWFTTSNTISRNDTTPSMTFGVMKRYNQFGEILDGSPSTIGRAVLITGNSYLNTDYVTVSSTVGGTQTPTAIGASQSPTGSNVYIAGAPAVMDAILTTGSKVNSATAEDRAGTNSFQVILERRSNGKTAVALPPVVPYHSLTGSCRWVTNGQSLLSRGYSWMVLDLSGGLLPEDIDTVRSGGQFTWNVNTTLQSYSYYGDGWGNGTISQPDLAINPAPQPGTGTRPSWTDDKLSFQYLAVENQTGLINLNHATSVYTKAGLAVPYSGNSTGLVAGFTQYAPPVGRQNTLGTYINAPAAYSAQFAISVYDTANLRCTCAGQDWTFEQLHHVQASPNKTYTLSYNSTDNTLGATPGVDMFPGTSVDPKVAQFNLVAYFWQNDYNYARNVSGTYPVTLEELPTPYPATAF